MEVEVWEKIFPRVSEIEVTILKRKERVRRVADRLRPKGTGQVVHPIFLRMLCNNTVVLSQWDFFSHFFFVMIMIIFGISKNKVKGKSQCHHFIIIFFFSIQ